MTSARAAGWTTALLLVAGCLEMPAPPAAGRLTDGGQPPGGDAVDARLDATPVPLPRDGGDGGCAERLGGPPAVLICYEEPGLCEFSAVPPGGADTCAGFCAGFGMLCQASFASAGQCAPTFEVSCFDTLDYLLCSCTY